MHPRPYRGFQTREWHDERMTLTIVRHTQFTRARQCTGMGEVRDWSPLWRTFTEAGRRLGSSTPRLSPPPWPALPMAFVGSPRAASLATISSCTGFGTRGNSVSK